MKMQNQVQYILNSYKCLNKHNYFPVCMQNNNKNNTIKLYAQQLLPNEVEIKFKLNLNEETKRQMKMTNDF